jgi:hypothetical protein
LPGKSAEKEMRLDPVYRGRFQGKSHKPHERRSRSVLFRGKKGRPLKTQVIIEQNSLEIIDVPQAKGSGT